MLIVNPLLSGLGLVVVSLTTSEAELSLVSLRCFRLVYCKQST